MNSSFKNQQVIAPTELKKYLEAQASAIAPELIPLVRVNIKVERVGFTRNASNTPYIVYWVGDRRCCTFIKRRVFLELVQVLLQLKYGIEDLICSVYSSPYFGLHVSTPEQRQYIASSYVNKFFERYNQVALEKTAPQPCDCNDLYEMCLHSLAKFLQPTIADYLEVNKPNTQTQLRSDLYPSDTKAYAQNREAYPQFRATASGSCLWQAKFRFETGDNHD